MHIASQTPGGKKPLLAKLYTAAPPFAQDLWKTSSHGFPLKPTGKHRETQFFRKWKKTHPPRSKTRPASQASWHSIPRSQKETRPSESYSSPGVGSEPVLGIPEFFKEAGGWMFYVFFFFPPWSFHFSFPAEKQQAKNRSVLSMDPRNHARKGGHLPLFVANGFSLNLRLPGFGASGSFVLGALPAQPRVRVTRLQWLPLLLALTQMTNTPRFGDTPL